MNHIGRYGVLCVPSWFAGMLIVEKRIHLILVSPFASIDMCIYRSVVRVYVVNVTCMYMLVELFVS